MKAEVVVVAPLTLPTKRPQIYAQLQTIMHGLQGVALSPPFDSPHLDFPHQETTEKRATRSIRSNNKISEGMVYLPKEPHASSSRLKGVPE